MTRYGSGQYVIHSSGRLADPQRAFESALANSHASQQPGGVEQGPSAVADITAAGGETLFQRTGAREPVPSRHWSIGPAQRSVV